MALEGGRPQFSKLGPSTKMGLASQFLQFFHPKSTKIDEKLYDDTLWVIVIVKALVLACFRVYV
jgi:hypothetical protein